MAHWFRRTVLAAVPVLLAVLGGTAPAAAGGPTSVLLSAPDIEKVTAVGYNQQAYFELQEAVQDPYAVAAANPPGAEPIGRVVRAAWLIHDQQVWRLDSIYVDAPGGAWIATTESLGGATPGKQVWHRSRNPAKLQTVLGQLGLLSGQATERPAPSAGTAAAPATPVATPPSRTVPAETPLLTGWRWSIPGFLLGAVIATAAVRLVPRRRPWELVDAE